MEDNNVMTFKNLFSYLKRALPVILVTMLITIIIGVIILSVNTFSNVNEETQSVIELTYRGADQGLDINGNKFDKNSLKAIDKINAAVAKVDNTLSPSEIYDNLTIEGSYSSNIQELLNNATNSEELLKLLNGASLVPTQYTLRMDYTKVQGLTKEKSRSVMEELIAINQKEYYAELDSSQYINVEIYDNTNIYNYAEFNSLMRLQTKNLESIAACYTSKEKIYNKIQYIEQMLNKLENFIYTNKAFNVEQKANMLSALQADYNYYNNLAETAKNNADAIKTIIQEYDIPITVKPDGTIIQVDINSTQYDKMFDKHNEYATKANELAAVAAEITDKITILTAITPADTIDEEISNTVTMQRNLIASELKALAVNVKSLQNEMINNGVENNGIKIVMASVNVKSNDVSIKLLLLDVIIMLVVGFAGGIIIYQIINTVFKNRKSKKGDNNDDSDSVSEQEAKA